MLYIEILAICISFLVGFAMKRGGTCTYVAVLQIIQHRKMDMMLLFLGASAWATVVIVPLSWWWPDLVSLSPAHHYIITALFGGLLLGLGAFFNKGCFFGTFVQLVGGNLTYMATLFGMSAAVAVTHIYMGFLVPKPSATSEVALPNLTAFYWLLFVGIFGLVVMLQKESNLARKMGVLKGLHFRKKISIVIMIIIGAGGGLLFSTISGWDYPSVITRMTLNLSDPQAIPPTGIAILCTLSMIAGGISAAVSLGNFVIQKPKLLPSINCFFGGALMGSAALIVPGGNDTILLLGMPSLVPHSFIAYALMIITMIFLVYLFRKNSN